MWVSRLFYVSYENQLHVSMLELIGETELKEKLRLVQGQLLAALKEDRPQILQDKISMLMFEEAMDTYQRLIQAHIAAT